MKPAEMPPTRQVLKPEPQPDYPCPRCGTRMTVGVVSVRQAEDSIPMGFPEAAFAATARLLSKAGAAMGGGPYLAYDSAGRDRCRVVSSGCVQTSYRCNCGVVAIFPV